MSGTGNLDITQTYPVGVAGPNDQLILRQPDGTGNFIDRLVPVVGIAPVLLPVLALGTGNTALAGQPPGATAITQTQLSAVQAAIPIKVGQLVNDTGYLVPASLAPLTATANAAIPASAIGVTVASLDASRHVPLSQMPPGVGVTTPATVAQLGLVLAPASGPLRIDANGVPSLTFGTTANTVADGAALAQAQAAIPTRTSQLANDSGFLAPAALANFATQNQVATAVNPVYGSVQTADATPTTIGGLPTLPLGPQAAQRMSWLIVAQDLTSGDVASWDAVLMVKRAQPNAAVAIVGTAVVMPTLVMTDASLLTLPIPTIGVATGPVVVVTGVAGRTMAWTVRPMHNL